MQGEASLDTFQRIVDLVAGNLIPVMIAVFVLAVVCRLLIYATVKREAWFVREFEKRVFKALPSLSKSSDLSFFHITKNNLQKTYHEIFELRRRFGRRHPDQIMSLNDRLFMVQEGVARLIMDFLRQARYLEKHHDHPRFLEISKSVFENNPIFARLFGLFSVSLMNNILNLLPGLFVIGGIFGTFLGIIAGLPALAGMDVTDSAVSQQVMNGFLAQITFAMHTSIVGIMLSVLMSIVNTVTAPENIYYSIINRFTTAVEILWNKADHNVISLTDAEFVEARDRLDIEAGEALRFDEQFKRDQFLLNNKTFFPEYFNNNPAAADDADDDDDENRNQPSGRAV